MLHPATLAQPSPNWLRLYPVFGARPLIGSVSSAASAVPAWLVFVAAGEVVVDDWVAVVVGAVVVDVVVAGVDEVVVVAAAAVVVVLVELLHPPDAAPTMKSTIRTAMPDVIC